jgi:hypothetical protein
MCISLTKSCHDHVIVIVAVFFSLQEGTLLKELTGHSSLVQSIAFSPNMEFIVSMH